MADRPHESESVLHAPPAPLVRMAAAPAGPSPDDLHELRVRIPVDLHRQLLSLKVLRGKSLAETVSLALDIYFQEHAAAQHARHEDDVPV